MTSTRPPGRGSPPVPRRDSLGEGRHAPGAYGADRRRPAPASSSPLMSILLYGGVALLALGVGAATFFIMSPPTDYIRREIIARVKAETGRDLRIAGPTSFTIFPSLGLSLSDVSLSTPPGMGGEPFVKMASFDVGVRLMPLLRQEIVVDRVELNEPVFSLRVDSNGRRSWDLASLHVPLRFARADAAWPRLSELIVSPAKAAEHREIAAVSLDDIRITNGAVRYNDERSGAWGRFDGLNAQFSLAAMDEPLTGSGSLVAEGETFEFKSTLTTPAELAQQRPAKLALTVSGMPLTFSYDGTIGPNDGAGTITASSPSLSALAHWWGNEVSPEVGAGEVAFTARLNATQTSVHLSDIDLKAGRTTASGTVGFEERQGARPHVAADLKISGLNVAELPLGAELRAGRGGSAVPAPTPLSLEPPVPAPPASEPDSIEDLLNRPASPQVKGYTQRAGWSNEPINIKALGLADADARLALSEVTYGRTRIDAAQVTVGVKDLIAKVTLSELRLYDGSGHGLITLDASGSDAAFTSDVALSGISARPLLRDAAQVDWLAGNADVAWKVSGHGTTEADIVRSLNGTSSVALRDGAVIGFDLGGAMSELSEGSIPSFALDAAKKTDFRSLTGTFAIADGIAANNDLKLDSQHLHASGDGTVDLPQRALDYTVRPKLVANLGGDGGEQNAVGIEVPVRITGSWEQPALSPDIEGAINNPNTVDAVKQIGKQLKGKKAGEIVQDLFGKGEDGGPSKAEKLLDSLFGEE
ncbi:AsmA family protein [Hyphomicrobium sp.]|uniref:AsmA family protein n=2 Tax=Hyphomicrobium sp. TaxID=82 RepID=UPI001325D046|nr:AsmA family protein [Hyphomicrobium sp.]KAB2937766.1 MAG: AsmA family protein [Hyphomicrobium sp.]